MSTSFDLIVTGAGPAGATCAAVAASAGQRVLMLDKASFPRDKICGDAISGKSTGVLRRLGLIDKVARTEALETWGVTFGGPAGDEVAIPFARDRKSDDPLSFVCPRSIFDEVLFRHALDCGATFRQDTVEGIVRDGQRVTGVRVNGEILSAPIVVGADGAYSVVARDLGFTQLDEAHYCAAVRAYYEGVTGFNDGNFIEVHFLDEAIPGYFWVFPMAGGRANVGVGMLSKAIKERDVRLKDLLDVCVNHPRFRERFAGARRIGTVKGWGLPLGSKPRKMAGDGWMLVGDAASLIDPFSGEGIGNAMLSGELAARWAIRGDATAAGLAGYEKEVLDSIRSELRTSYALQRLVSWRRLLNLVIRKASRNPQVAAAISGMFENEANRRNLVSPLFYMRLLLS